MIAKGGNVYAVISGKLENVSFTIDFVLTAVNCEIFFFHRLGSFNSAEFAGCFAATAFNTDTFVDHVRLF